MKNFTPRHMRRKYRTKHSDDKEKKRAFARVARWSKRFIHLSADALAKPKIASHYEAWGDKAKKGSLRAGK